MGGTVILNWVLGAIIFLLIVGGGVYAIVRHGKAGPNDREARRHFGAKQDPSVTPLSDYVPTGPVAAVDGLTEPRAPLTDAGSGQGAASRDQVVGPGGEPE
jgi:hypothetical protein